MPIFSIIFSIILLKEKIFLNQILGIFIGVSCLIFILHSEGIIVSYTGFIGVLAILCAALMHGFLYVYSKKMAANISVFTFNTLPIGVAGILLCIFSFLFENPDIEKITVNSWFTLIYLGFVASVGGFIVYFYLLKRMSPIVLSFIFIIFPVVAIAIDAYYEHKPITSTFIFYSILMLLGFSLTKIPFNKIFSKKITM